MCLPIISAENWKPATKTDQGKTNQATNQPTTNGHCRTKIFAEFSFYFFSHTHTVIQALIALVNDPEPEHPLRADLAEEFQKDRKKFNKAAEEFTRKHSEKRPNE